jgi:hypothetical protein
LAKQTKIIEQKRWDVDSARKIINNIEKVWFGNPLKIRSLLDLFWAKKQLSEKNIIKQFHFCKTYQQTNPHA